MTHTDPCSSGAQRPIRKHPAHPTPIDRVHHPTLVFVTVCLSHRVDLLANEPVHQALRAAWRSADHWLVGRYLIMPDHLHLFCTRGVPEPLAIPRWTRKWKDTVSRRVSAVRGRWQRDCWDTQLRSPRDYEEKLAYVLHNPVRAGLVERPEDWPFTGRMHDLIW